MPASRASHRNLSNHVPYVPCQPIHSVTAAVAAAASLTPIRCRDVAVTRLLPQPSRLGKLRRPVSGRRHRSALGAQQFWDSVQSWMTRVGRKTTLGASTALFSVCQRHVEHGYWQRHAHIGDDFRSTHMLLVLHVWMVHKRLLTEGKRGLLVQESLFDTLWDNTSDRMYKKGIPEISALLAFVSQLNKYLKEVQAYSFRTCVELDQSLDQLKLSLEELNAQKQKDRRELEHQTPED
eukprot:gene16899-19297_t